MLLALSYQMPGHFLPWASFQAQWLAALAVGLIGLGALTSSPSPVLGWPRLALVCIATAVLPWLQWFAGQVYFLSDALMPSAYLVATALALVTGALLAARHGRTWLDGLFAALIVGAALGVAISVLQWLQVGGLGLWVIAVPPGGRIFGNLGQPNHLATLIVLAMIGAWRAYENRRLTGPLSMALMIGLAAGLVGTQSRTGWLMVAIMFGWWFTWRRRAQLRAPVWAAVGLMFLFASSVLAWSSVNVALDLTAGPSLTSRLEAGPRPVIWAAMARAIMEAPWVGYGWNQVALAQQAVATLAAPVHHPLDSAHNLVLDLALWGGIPLAGIWIACLAIWYFRRWRTATEDTWAVLLAVTALFVHAQLEYPLEQTYFLLPLALLMGSLRAPAPGGVVLGPYTRATLVSLLVGMIGLLGWVGSEYLRVERGLQNVRLHQLGVDQGEGRENLPPDVRLLDAPREYHRLIMSSAHAGMSDAEIDWMRAVVQLHPYPPAQMRLALALGLNGRSDEAALTLLRLCAMHPAVRCDEAREGWRAAQSRWPGLDEVSLP